MPALQIRVMGFIGTEIADLQMTVNTANKVNELRRALLTFVKNCNFHYSGTCKDVVLSAGHTDQQKIRGLHGESLLGEVIGTTGRVSFHIITWDRNDPWDQ